MNSEAQSTVLSCLEVWGGNDSEDRHVELMGLDAWLFSKAYGDDSKGGDVYYVSSCATGRITRLLVADVSGHGVAVSAPAEILRTLMRRYVNQIDQRRFVRAMNRAFSALSQSGVFATAVVATYFAPTRALTLTNAGHPPPARYNVRMRSWTFLDARAEATGEPTDIPLGVLELSEYDQQELLLHHGDMVLCYSDALIECRDIDGTFLGGEGLKRMLARIDVEPPEQVIPALLSELRRLYPGNLEQDDVTVLLVKPNSLFATAYRGFEPRRHLAAMKKIYHALRSKDDPVPWPDLHPANLGGAVLKSLNKLWGRHLKD